VSEEEKLIISKPKRVAGGAAAVLNSAKHVFSEVGVLEGTKTLLKLNQFDGFDCPGCAWPDPDDHRSVVEFCENGAKAIAEEATTEKCDREFFEKHSVSEMRQWSDYELGKSGRIAEPMLLLPGNDHYKPIEWSGAFDLIGKKLKALASPNEAIFYTSGRTSNEAAFMYQLFVRMYGTNNLPDCSNMCHESSGVALTETLGIGKGSVTLEDFYQAEVIIIMGQNPGTNHPRMLTALEKAKQNGAYIITINPIQEAGLISFRHPQHVSDMLGKPTVITDLWLQVKINEDVALLKAILKILFENEAKNPGSVFDLDFIKNNTTGFEEFKNELNKYDTDQLIEKCGVDRKKVFQTASVLSQKKKIIACWAMGLTQHANAVDNIREIVNLLLVKGSIGKPGAGTCPVRGHSNVQGDRTVGIYEKPKPEFLDRLQKVFGFSPPREDGYDTVGSIKAMAEGRAKVFIAMGGNFLSATPDTEFTSNALQQCDLTVHISTKLNRSHLAHGKTALILPCLGRTEADIQGAVNQLVSVENSAGVVHQSLGSKKPISDKLLSEPAIVAGLARATLSGHSIAWNDLVKDYDHIRVLIEKTIPGFENYNQRVRRKGGFYLPNGAREGKFKTISERAHFTVNQLAAHQLAHDEFLMMTIRSHDQYNTTIYGLDDRYRGIYRGRRVIFMNEGDMKTAGLKKGDRVDIISRYDGVERSASDFKVVPYVIPSQNLATYFPEANAVVPHNRYAHGSRTPISKSVVVKLVKH